MPRRFEAYGFVLLFSIRAFRVQFGCLSFVVQGHELQGSGFSCFGGNAKATRLWVLWAVAA